MKSFVNKVCTDAKNNLGFCKLFENHGKTSMKLPRFQARDENEAKSQQAKL